MQLSKAKRQYIYKNINSLLNKNWNESWDMKTQEKETGVLFSCIYLPSCL